MGKRDEKPSLIAMIEQTAKMLRGVLRPPSKKNRSYSKEPLSPSNRIEQIAKMLRQEAKNNKK